MSWKDARRKAGYRDRLMWLTPAAETALAKLRPTMPGLSLGDVVSAVIERAGADVDPSFNAGPAPALSSVTENQFTALADRVAMLEAVLAAGTVSVQTVEVPAIEVETVTQADDAPTTPAKRIVKGTPDYIALMNCVADKVAEVGGWDFVLLELHRELVAKGVRIQETGRNFGFWATARRAEVAEVLAQRQVAA